MNFPFVHKYSASEYQVSNIFVEFTLQPVHPQNAYLVKCTGKKIQNMALLHQLLGQTLIELNCLVVKWCRVLFQVLVRPYRV
jgi:hypothetical protein